MFWKGKGAFLFRKFFLQRVYKYRSLTANVVLICPVKHVAYIFKRTFCTTHQEHTVGGADVASFPHIFVAAMLALLVEWVSECPNM